MSKLIFEMSRKGRRAFELPESGIPERAALELFPKSTLGKSRRDCLK